MNANITPEMQDITGYYDRLNDKITRKVNPFFIIIGVSIVALFFMLFRYLGGGEPVEAGSSGKGSAGAAVIKVIGSAVLVFLLLVNGLQYFFSISIKAVLKDMFSPVPEIDLTITSGITEDVVPEITSYEEVYHIPGNSYTYPNAKALCQAYDGRLATYEEIEGAYSDNAEWCSYGWSDNQLALFPTQTETYDKLQKIKGHENDCGRPGINGGYIKNPNVRFGVNCYGHKPKITPEENKLMRETPLYPVTNKERLFQRKVDAYRQKLPEILVSPFNHSTWSKS